MLESLLAKEGLLPGTEDEVLSTIGALQSFVSEYDGSPPASCAL